jgi:diadenosine tetraphosphate (Ap4A) HIT family hydrolase
MAEFKIHPALLVDAHYLGQLAKSHVLLHRNAAVPWFILVPETEIADLLDLPDEPRDRVVREAAAISSFIKQALGYQKVNFASIGNIVPQLHLHVVGRAANDSCWPAPVWGNLPTTKEYSAAELDGLRQRLRDFFGARFVEPCR